MVILILAKTVIAFFGGFFELVLEKDFVNNCLLSKWKVSGEHFRHILVYYLYEEEEKTCY